MGRERGPRGAQCAVRPGYASPASASRCLPCVSLGRNAAKTAHAGGNTWSHFQTETQPLPHIDALHAPPAQSTSQLVVLQVQADLRISLCCMSRQGASYERLDTYLEFVWILITLRCHPQLRMNMELNYIMMSSSTPLGFSVSLPEGCARQPCQPKEGRARAAGWAGWAGLTGRGRKSVRGRGEGMRVLGGLDLNQTGQRDFGERT